jgi:YVTN family beta-propeller protein
MKNIDNLLEKIIGISNNDSDIISKAANIKNENYSPDSLNSIASLLLDKGYYEYAEKIYDALLELSPTSSSAMYNKGLAIFNLGQYEKSISVFEQVINLNKDYIAEAYTSKATALEYLKRPEDAKQFYDLATNEYSARIQKLTDEAQSLQKSGDYIESINYVKQILTLEPNNKDGLYLKSFALFNLGRYEESIPAFEKYIENDPDNINVLSHYGRAYLSLNKNDDALKIFNKVIEMDPKNSDAMYYRGLSLYNLHQYSKAAESFEEARNFNPQNSDALTKLHDIYSNYLFERGEALKISKLLDKSTFENKAALVEDLIKTKNYEEAIKHAKAIEEEIPYQQTEGQCIIRFLLLAAYLLKGNFRKGIIELNKFFEYYTGIGDTGFKIRDIWSFRGLTDYIENGNADKKSKDIMTNILKLLTGVEHKERVLARMNNILADSNVKIGQENQRVKKIYIPITSAAIIIVILSISIYYWNMQYNCSKLDLPLVVLDVNEPNDLTLDPKTQTVYVQSSTGKISKITCKEYQPSEVPLEIPAGSFDYGTYAFAPIPAGSFDYLTHAFAPHDDDLVVYVVNSKNNTISVYNSKNGPVKLVKVGERPTSIAADPSTGLVYVAYSKNNTISVYNSKNNSVGGPVEVRERPTSIAADPSTGLVYVVNSKNNSISVYNSNSKSVGTVPVPAGAYLSQPTSIAVNPSTHLAYVAIGKNYDKILVINGLDKKISGSVNVGPNDAGTPKSISIGNNKIYVANSKSNTISVIDGINHTIINTIATPNVSPADIEIVPKLDTLYIATKDNNGQVYLINNPASYRSNIGFSLLQVGDGPTGIAADPSTGLVYVANSKDNTISVYNSKNGSVGKPVEVGEGPTGIAADPSTGFVYVANSKDNTISVYNSKNGSIGKPVEVGDGPTSIAVDNSTGLVYVANSKDNTISVYNSKNGSVETMNAGTDPKQGPTGIAVGPNSKNNTISVYNSKNGSVETMNAGTDPKQGPTGIAVDPSTHLIYVIRSENDSIAVMNKTNNNTLVELNKEFVGEHPEQVVVDAENDRVYVSNSKGDNITILSLKSLGVRNNESAILGNISSSDNPIGFALDRTRNDLIVANRGIDTISVIKLNPVYESEPRREIMSKIESIPNLTCNMNTCAGQSQESLAALESQGKKLGELDSNIDSPHGGHPHSVAMDNDTLYVTNYDHNTILIKNMSEESRAQEMGALMAPPKVGQIGR